MSEELIQRKLLDETQKIGNWNFYNIGATNLNALKENNIIKDKDYKELGRRKPDGIIVSNNKEIIAIIENKNPINFNTDNKKREAIDQALDLTEPLGVKIAIATDGVDTIWINGLNGEYIKDNEDNKIKHDFNYKDKEVERLIIEIHKSINEENSKLTASEIQDPTPLATKVWQDVWAVSGATPENCLYTFVEIFIFKYISDLGILGSLYNFDYLFNRYSEDSPDEVLNYYAKTIRPKMKSIFPEDPIDKTSIINGTIFVSKDNEAIKSYSNVFKDVLTNFKKFGKLEKIDLDFKSKIFESFLKESISKKNWGQFFTPLNIVNPMVKMAEIRENIKVCDPASGVGKLLLQSVHSELDRFYKVTEEGKIEPTIELKGFDKGFDQEEQRTIILAKANMLIYFSEFISNNIDKNKDFTKEFSSLLNNTFKLKTNSILGTLKDPVHNEYDLILTNPPYVTSGSKGLRDEIRKDLRLTEHYKDSGMGIEGLFMRWIMHALKKGGQALVVIPDGLLNRSADTNLRKKVLEDFNINLLISLPINTFYTTNKKTYILGIEKKRGTEKQSSPVFTYLASDIGETLDIDRFPTGNNQVEIAANLYNQFKGSKDTFTTEDKRCKIVDIDKFIDDVEFHWLIDRWWTEEEQIELGIKEEKEEMTLFQLSSLVDEISLEMQNFKNELIDIEDGKKKIDFKKTTINELFKIKRGKSKYTKKYGNENKGLYPVYSASRGEALTYINSYDFDGNYLTWSTNGFAGYMDIKKDKFSVNGDRGILILKEDENNINIEYIKYLLEPKLREMARGRQGEKGKNEYTKVYTTSLEEAEVEINIPIDLDGEYSIEYQNYIVKRYEIIEEYKKIFERYKNILSDINYSKDEFGKNNIKIFDVKDIFKEPVKGKQKYTKDYIIKNQGDYPLISSQTTNKGILGYLNSWDHEGEAITWSTDGIYAGTTFYRNQKFSMTTHAGALFLKEEYKDKIDLQYINAYFKSCLKEYTVGEGNKRLTLTRMKNKVKINVPITDKDEIDIEQQRIIAEEYQYWDNIRFEVIKHLERILEIKITDL